MSKFVELFELNVNDRVEKKEGLSYLSWAWAWAEFKKKFPDATYEVIKNPDGMPYFANEQGAICYTKVTAEGLTYEMWLPVMDGKNKAMKWTPYEYTTRSGTKTVEAFTLFDVNKTIMRCLVKNLAMFGLGLYIYAGEDLPDVAPEQVDLTPLLTSIYDSQDIAQLKTNYLAAYKKVANDPMLLKQLEKAKDSRKLQLEAAAAETAEQPKE